MDGVAEPDSDGGDVDSAAPDVVALVEPGGHGAVLAEAADGALDGVALFVGGRVEGRWPAAVAAASAPVGGLVGGFGDGGLAAAAAQVRPGGGAGVGLVAEQPPRPGPGPARARAGDREPVHQWVESQRIVALPGAGELGQRPALRVGEQVNLAGKPAAGAA